MNLLGYGIAADCKRTSAQGLAYLYHSYLCAYTSDPETSSNRTIGNFGKGTEEPLAVLQKGINVNPANLDKVNVVPIKPRSYLASMATVFLTFENGFSAIL